MSTTSATKATQAQELPREEIHGAFVSRFRMNQRNSLRQASQLLTFTLILTAASALADVKLPVIFSDHMVLQRDQKVPVWGWADEGEKVTIEFPASWEPAL